MKLSTIDEIIERFDGSYHKYKNKLFLEYKSVDKFVEVSYDYAMGLQADNFEKEAFMSYFKNHVTSMYRRDFEPILLESEKNNVMSEDHKYLIKFTWSGIFGTLGFFGGYAITKSAAGAMVGTTIGVAVGIYFANKDSKVKAPKNNILGTNEYEKQIRNELYDSLLDLK